MTVHAATIDYSPDTGSLVACTCGLVLGPFHEYGEAKKAAAEHRRWTGAEVVASEGTRRERRREQNAESAARRVARKAAEAAP
jgi:hypothetical protein